MFNLTKLEDFSGNYAAAGAEATVGGGAGATVMRNQNGVVIELMSTTQGANRGRRESAREDWRAR